MDGAWYLVYCNEGDQCTSCHFTGVVDRRATTPEEKWKHNSINACFHICIFVYVYYLQNQYLSSNDCSYSFLIQMMFFFVSMLVSQVTLLLLKITLAYIMLSQGKIIAEKWFIHQWWTKFNWIPMKSRKYCGKSHEQQDYLWSAYMLVRGMRCTFGMMSKTEAV